MLAQINPSTRVLLTGEVSALLNIRPQTLAIWWCKRRYDLPFIKVGRLIRYRAADVEQWPQGRSSVSRG